MELKMNENEKAAIAGGQWVPNEWCVLEKYVTDSAGVICSVHGKRVPHMNTAPDMHDGANLWRALVYRVRKGDRLRFNPEDGDITEGFYRGLVALYDAEHPNE